MTLRESVIERGMFLAQQRANVMRIFQNVEGAIAENNEVMKLLDASEMELKAAAEAQTPTPPEPAPEAEAPSVGE